MKSIRRLLALVIFVPLAIVVAVLAAVNRHPVRIVLDPFAPEQPALDVQVPLFLLLLGAVLLGVLAGGIATWFGQQRYRGQARRARAEASRLQRELDELRRRQLSGEPPVRPSPERAGLPSPSGSRALAVRPAA